MRRTLLRLLLPLLPVCATAEEPAFIPVCYPGGTSGVDYSYAMGMFEVTNEEYAAFLNAKAASDPHGLFAASEAGDSHNGIARSGASGSYVYTVKPGFERLPVVFVSGFSAMRYCNWLHNGGGAGSTETGAYTLSAGFVAPRQAGARYFIPTFPEWKKAGYWQPPLRAGNPNTDGILAGFWKFPGRTNAIPDFGRLTNGHLTDANQYNVQRAVTGRGQSDPTIANYLHLSKVGAYIATRSWFGTYDNGGNAGEIIEETVSYLPGTRQIVGSDALRSVSEVTGGNGGIVQVLRPTDTTGLRATGLRIAANLGPAGFDGGAIGFASAGISAVTGTNPARVPVYRRGGVGSVSVSYITSNGTAIAGSDYTNTSGVLTFGPGQSVSFIDIPFTPSSFTGTGKTIRLRLNNPLGGAVLGANDGTELRVSPTLSAPALAISRSYVTPGAVALNGGSAITTGVVDRFTPLVNSVAPNGFVRVHYDVTNTGTANVSIDQYVLQAVQNCTASLVNTLPSGIIVPGATVTLQAQVNVTTKDQPWAATWSFGSNLPDQPLVGWTMASVTSTAGLAPVLSVDRWGAVVQGSTDVVRSSRVGVPTDVSYVMAVDGIGGLTLSSPSFNGSSNATVSLLESLPTTMRAGEQATLRLRITHENPGPWSVPVSLGIAGQTTRTWVISGQAAAAGSDQEPDITDTYRMPRNGALTMLVRGVDPDGPRPAVLAVGAPSNGTLTRITGPVISGSGEPVAQSFAYVYRPANNFTGTVTIPVTLAHAGGSVVRSMTVLVEPAPEIEVRLGAVNLSMHGETTLNGVVAGQPYRILLGVTNMGTAPLNLQPAFGLALVGTVSAGSLGRLIVDPGTSTSVPVTVLIGQTGSFSVDVVIGNDDVDESPFVLTLKGNAGSSAVNQPPVALAQRVTTNLGTPVVIGLAGIDPEGSVISAGAVGTPGKGTLSGSGLTRTYTPDAGYIGNDSFTYTVSDGSLASAAVTVNITVQAAPIGNTAPMISEPAASGSTVLVLP